MGLNDQFTVIDDASLEHNSAWLVDRDLGVTHACVVIGYTAIAVHDWSLTLARIDHADVFCELWIELLTQLCLEELLVD